MKNTVDVAKDVVLDVPYYSEFEEIDGSDAHISFFKRRSCGIVSAKMVADYICKSNDIKKVPLSKMIEMALDQGGYVLENGGKKDYGWQHAGIVRAMQKLGFVSYRRRFFILSCDIDHLKKEGENRKALDRYYEQVFDEAMSTFKKKIDDGIPFLISIIKNLGIKKTSHIIVITGYREESGKIVGFFVNDPNNPKKSKKLRQENKNQFISLKEFDRIWRKTSIFIEME